MASFPEAERAGIIDAAVEPKHRRSREMESVQLAIIRTGGTWARFVIAAEPRGLSSNPLYWDGADWVAEKRTGLLYADPELAERDLVKLREKMCV